MDEVEKVTRETVQKGGVLARLYFDIHARTKDATQQISAAFINELIHKEGVVYALGEIDEPIEGGENKNWSTTVEVKLLGRNFATLAGICLGHSPYSVEILRPNEIKLQIGEAHELLSAMSVITADYKKHILLKLAKPEEIAEIQENLRKRAEMGKNLLEKTSGAQPVAQSTSTTQSAS